MSRVLGRLLAVGAAGIVAVALAAAADAKGNLPLQLCGPKRCASLGSSDHPPVRLGPVSRGRAPAPPPGPYYVLRYPWEGGDIAYWIPSAHLLRLTSTSWVAAWLSTRPAETRVLRRAARSLAPYRAVHVRNVVVDGIVAKEPQTYLELYSVGRPAHARSLSWMQIWLEGDQSPWTDGQNDLWIAENGPYLRRDGELLRIPSKVARRIRSGAPL